MVADSEPARPLRIALLSYRSKPHCGGQGVYVRHLSRELAALGHHVTVVSGPPYPMLDRLGDGVDLVRLPSLDLYREPDPFRMPRLREYRDWIDVLEVATMCTAGFGEPRTFSLRARRWLRDHGDRFDVVHDNQGLGSGMLAIARRTPLVTTIHHPISRDRRTDLAAARGWRRLSLHRWYGFVRMQARVARRLDHIVTVSQSSARDIVADFGVAPERVEVVPLGVDTEVFAPGPTRVPGRIVAMASADTPLKGVDTLLEAIAALPAVRELVLVATPGERTRRLVAALGLGMRVRFVAGISDAELAVLIGSAQLACVPSRYEGFSLPAVEALASGTPVVASRAGALPEVLGDDGRCAQLVPPGDPAALRGAIGALLADDARREAMGVAGRERAVQRFAWPAVARATVALYLRAMGVAPAGDDEATSPVVVPPAPAVAPLREWARPVGPAHPGASSQRDAAAYAPTRRDQPTPHDEGTPLHAHR